MIRKILGKSALIAGLLMALAACGSDAPATSDGSVESITVYSGREKDLVEPVFEKFTTATGIKVEARYGDSAELAAQILEEGDNSPADVFFAQDAGALGAVQEAGRLSALPGEMLTTVPERFRSSSGAWVGVSGRARTVVYNTESVNASDLPGSIMGFTDPKWKDKIGWAPANASFQAFVTALRITQGEDAARRWLTGVKSNGAQVYPKNSAIVEAVGKGEIQIGFVNHYYLLQLKREDPQIKAENHFFKDADPGALVNVAGAGVLKTSKRADAARRFVEYLIGQDAQRYFATETFEYPLAQGIDADERLPKLSTLEPPKVDLNALRDLAATLKLLKEAGL